MPDDRSRKYLLFNLLIVSCPSEEACSGEVRDQLVTLFLEVALQHYIRWGFRPESSAVITTGAGVSFSKAETAQYQNCWFIGFLPGASLVEGLEGVRNVETLAC